MSDENQSKKKVPMPHPVHISEIQKFLLQCRVKRGVTPVQEHGNAMMAAVQRGDVVYLVNKKGCAHLNAGWNLRKALIEVGWKGLVESIFRVGTRQSVSGKLNREPHKTHSQSSPIRIPDFAAIDAAKAETAAPATPELAPVVPLNPQQ